MFLFSRGKIKGKGKPKGKKDDKGKGKDDKKGKGEPEGKGKKDSSMQIFAQFFTKLNIAFPVPSEFQFIGVFPGDLMMLQQFLRNLQSARLASTKSDKIRFSVVLEGLLDYSAFAVAVANQFIRPDDRLLFPPGPNSGCMVWQSSTNEDAAFPW